MNVAAMRSLRLGSLGLLVGALLSAVSLRAEVPRPEHLRPDCQRDSRLNLNGEWQFEVAAKGDGETRGRVSSHDLTRKIIMPFCTESKREVIG